MNRNYQATADAKLQNYENEVILKYQIYNGLFLGLPFADPDQAGSRLPIFTRICQDLMDDGYNVPDAVDKYLTLVPVAEDHKLKLLNKFLQFIERQVVLFDALEDTAFEKIKDMSGYGTVDYMMQRVKKHSGLTKQLDELLENYKTRLVLTAHPTQFYPTIVLSIIAQLSKAIKDNELDTIRDLFLQMGLTSFNNKVKPTPSDEATSIIWYLEHIFYNVIPETQTKLSTKYNNLDIGFWPGGDRDGNPFVTANVTLETSDKLHNSIMRLYYQDIKHARATLTFDGVYDQLSTICDKIKNAKYNLHTELIADVTQVADILNSKYQGLFIEKIENIILKINLFKFNFAKLDIRQNSAIHKKVVHTILASNNITEKYSLLSDNEKLEILLANFDNPRISLDINDELVAEVINTVKAIATIQKKYGKSAIERYIISNTDSMASIIEVLWFVNLVNRELIEDDKILIEIVPLFETVDDLHASEQIMGNLFNLPYYAANLKNLNQHQTIMLGFSDGTKDGGYLMANWSIFQAKKRLSILAKKYAIDITFFDGRGGPPSRGGGNTYEFYQSLAQEIEAHEVQLTIQGQTISANFGTHNSAIYNLEHLLSAGLSGRLFTQNNTTINSEQEAMINKLAERALSYYLELRNDPLFLDYLLEITPLNYLTSTNIGSRPAKRNKDDKLKLEDLRAIPFGGAWMQMKQNILGYYGFGSAINELTSAQPETMKKLQKLYNNSSYFRGLIDNSMQSLATTNFTVTKHLANDPKFGRFWQQLCDEAELSKKMLMSISGSDQLIANNPVKKISTEFREQIIAPLLLIQQFAMDKVRKLEASDESRHLYENLVRRSLAANINASRNSI